MIRHVHTHRTACVVILRRHRRRQTATATVTAVTAIVVEIVVEIAAEMAEPTKTKHRRQRPWR